ncbi:hypothetical protein MN116_008923 [Schistosoma mekongi]|uniref:Uncharacterized protein n=1 Tax=Schistosoma mekongi TaxID=38744 RepID=A0AAE2D1D2_SCHME|nr:hypothetical protein MN116_008923 [Schistosoma mekongi]
MDLSYYPVNFISSSNELSANASTLRINDNPRTKFYVISNHPTNSTCDPSSRQLNEESSSCQLVNEHPYSGMFLKKGTNTTRFSRPLLSDTVHPIKSSLAPRNSSSLSISPICEWQIVLHLICYLTRLTPQLIPSTIIHAVAAPCLEVRRFLVTASNESCYRGGGRGDATVGVSAVAVVSRRTSRNRPNRIGESREGKVKINDFDDLELDTTIRGCLLILTELGMFVFLIMSVRSKEKN